MFSSLVSFKVDCFELVPLSPPLPPAIKNWGPQVSYNDDGIPTTV